MSDLLKEAIADAKAVRETALQNAKMALQEAFTPQIKSMLSAKLREDEFEDEEEFGHDEEDAEEAMYATDEVPGDEFSGEEEVPGDEFSGEEEVPEDEFGEEEHEVEEEGIIEINGVKYAPVVSEDEMFESEETDDDQELDLESVIKELESELDEGEHDDDETVEESDNPYANNEQHNDYKSVKKESVEDTFEIDESLFEEGDDEEEELDEVDQSSAIGKGTGRGNTDRSSGIGTANKKLTKENYELKEAVVFLKDKLHEVNILNAKLLFTNKIFKEFVLSNNQKMKVVENFDRAHTTREIKLVYSTLCESFNEAKNIRKKSINEVASAKTGSTRPSRKIISEGDAIAERFKKLANIK